MPCGGREWYPRTLTLSSTRPQAPLPRTTTTWTTPRPLTSLPSTRRESCSCRLTSLRPLPRRYSQHNPYMYVHIVIASLQKSRGYLFCMIYPSHLSFSLSQVRLEGMRHLLQFPSGDLITCENWETLHQAVRHAFVDSDTQLSVSSSYYQIMCMLIIKSLVLFILTPTCFGHSLF